MIVVADSSPLRYLVLLDAAHVLQHLFGRVVVPDAVASELSSVGAPTPVREWIAKPPTWLDIVTVSDDEIAAVTDEIDLGERAAIALATQLSAEVLLIDDAAGREEARRRRLR
jgi:predicted nucleic acid-binding protein